MWEQHSNSRKSPNDTRAPRVIVFSPRLLPWSETFILEQTMAMKRWQPTLVGERAVKDGLCLKTAAHLLLCPSPNRMKRAWYTLCKRLGLAHPPSLRRLRKLQASLIHVHFGTAAVDYWPLIRKLRLPVVITLHGFDIQTRPEWWASGHGGLWRRSYPRQLRKLGRQAGVAFIAVSEAIRAKAIELGLPADRIFVQHIGVDISTFLPGATPITERPRRALFAARLVEKKGARFLIDAFKRITPRMPDAELIIAGEGIECNALRSQAQDIDSIRFAGRITPGALRELMHEARVVCCPSVTAANGDAEGLPTILVEAQACGVPVITSAKDSDGEAVLHGVTGWCFAEGDVDALSGYLESSLSDQEACNTMGRMARQHVLEHFSLSACTQAMESLFDNLASPSRPAPGA